MKTLLDSLTSEQQLKFLSTKDKDGKTAIQRAPATGRKDMDKMLKYYKCEADFEVNYGKLALLSHLTGLLGTSIIIFLNRYIYEKISFGIQQPTIANHRQNFK